MRHSRSTRTVMLLFAIGLAGALSACATGAGPSDGPRRSANRITLEELADYSTLNALDAIRRLRPRWLQARGATAGGANEPVAILDGARLGSPDALASVAVSDVSEMQYLSAADATMRYGTNFPGGAIEVRTRAR
ncbi:MAG: hypothetical protein OEO23_07840 [Gemmatimonadota bacterium]|nr:hypothetical protein [Gemmatimonadota bacterium]